MTSAMSRTQARWARLHMGANLGFWGVGTALTIYVAVATLGFGPGSVRHYSNFVLGILVMSGLLSIRSIIGERIEGTQSRWFWPRLVLAVVALFACAFSAGYIRVNAVRLASMAPFFEDFDLVVGFIMIFGVLVLNWFHWGSVLTLFIAAAIVYFFLGHNIDNILFSHPPYDTNFVMNYISLGTTQGFFWLAQLAADSIYFLVIYAAVLVAAGVLELVLEAGKAGGRRVRGGAAFASIFGSSVVGAVMGQSVSNVVLTGRMTIPMMKKYGYEPAMAGGIEASAGTVGQVLPPIMGLSAFIIASLLGLPYIDVALAALIPALLYICGNLIGVFAYAGRRQLPKPNEPVDAGAMWRILPTFLISFGLVLWLLLGYHSPSYAGLGGVVAASVLCLFQGRHRPGWRQVGRAIDEGFMLVAILSLLIIAIGALGQTAITTNIAGRLGTVLLWILPDSQLLLLAGAMVVSLILGMGLPTPVAYIVASLAMVPYLQQGGIAPLLAHFFVFYFAVFSTLSPPAAVSVLAAAKLADAGFGETAMHAMKLASTTFIIPFAFVYNPELMAFPDLSWDMLLAVIEVLAIQIAVSVCLYGYLARNLVLWERVAFGALAVLAFAAMTSEPVYYWYLCVYGAFAAMLAWVLVPGMLASRSASTPGGVK